MTADDPRFDEWPNRKPSKTNKLAAKLRDRPLDYVADEASRRIARTIRSKTGGRNLGRLAERVAGVEGVAAAVGAGAGVAAILAAAYVVGDTIARNQQVKLGDRLNAISSRFAETQRQLEKAFRTTTWAGVPADVRSKAVSDYKAAIATATSRAQGSAFAGVREVGSYK